MPGYHNLLDLTLERPGRYVVRCFEYCGIGHAVMEGSFAVAAR
jgi:heme/copper-type cytochrome/quinol oxidase subunit 2